MCTLRPFKQPLHRRAQRPIRQRAVRPDRVAAEGRDLDRTQQADRGRLGQEGRIGMPARPEQKAGALVRLLDQRLHLGKSGHALGIGILGKGAEAAAEGGLVTMRHPLLAAKIDHLVAEQRRFDLGKGGVADVRAIDARDLRPHRGGERAHVDVLVRDRRIVEMLVRRKDHGRPSHSGRRPKRGPSAARVNRELELAAWPVTRRTAPREMFRRPASKLTTRLRSGRPPLRLVHVQGHVERRRRLRIHGPAQSQVDATGVASDSRRPNDSHPATFAGT